MADDLNEDFDIVAAIGAVLNSEPESEAPQQAATPQQAQEPEPDPIQPQEDAEASQPEANASEVAQAPADDNTAPAVPEPKAQPASSPELEQRVSEATKTSVEAAAARDQFLNALNVLVPQLQAAVAGEFADIKSEEDVLALMDPNSQNYNPDRYNKYVMATRRLQGAQMAQQRVHGERVQETVRTELAKVAKQLPDFTDPTKGPALRESLKAFAKSKGIEVENRPFLASDVLTLHSLMTAEQKVAQYESAKASEAAKIAEAQKKAAKAPPVQQPGVQRDTNKNDKASTDFSRFDKTGKPEDLARFLQNYL